MESADFTYGGRTGVVARRLTTRPYHKRERSIVLPNGNAYMGDVVMHDGCVTPHGDGSARDRHGMVLRGMWNMGQPTVAVVTSKTGWSVVEMEGGQTHGWAVSVWRTDELKTVPVMKDCNMWWGQYNRNRRKGFGMLISHAACAVQDGIERIMQIGMWDAGFIENGQRSHSSGKCVRIANRMDVLTRPHPLVTGTLAQWIDTFNTLEIPTQSFPIISTVQPHAVLPLDLQTFPDFVTSIKTANATDWKEHVSSMPRGNLPTFVFLCTEDQFASFVPCVTDTDNEMARGNAGAIMETLHGMSQFRVLLIFNTPAMCTKMVLYTPTSKLAPTLVHIHECTGCGKLDWFKVCAACGAWTLKSVPRLKHAGILHGML